MNRTLIGDLNLWEFESLAKEDSIKHFVTDRTGLHKGTEFTLSYSSTPDRDAVVANRNLLALAMGVRENELYLPSQVHKTKIVEVTRRTKKEDLMETDALISAERNRCIAVMAADCVPILLYDKKNKAIGAVHSGWRGSVARILEKTLHEMQARFGTRGDQLLAAIGPSVSQASYEVGEEVVQAVNSSFGLNNNLMIPQNNNKAKLDLWKANELQLLEFGVASANIEVANLCTIINNDHFFSARKGDAGRFAAGIVLL